MTKKTLYLHLGTNKTGSSAIQYFLYNNKSLLDQNDFYYPSDGTYFNLHEYSQSLLAHAVKNSRPEYLSRKVSFTKEKCIEDIKRDLEKSKASNVVVSSEHFSVGYDKQMMEQVRDIFAAFFDEIKVIIYLRRQDLYLESEYNQATKTGANTDSFDVFAAKKLERNYYDFLEMLSSVFNHNQIIVRPFEASQLFNNDLVSDFLNTVGLNVNTERIIKNESISVEMLEVLRTFNKNFKLIDQRKALHAFLRSAAIPFNQEKYTICPPELRKKILDKNRLNNALVAKKYLGRDDGILFHEPEVSALPFFTGITLDRFSEISSIIWSFQFQAYFKLKNAINPTLVQQSK